MGNEFRTSLVTFIFGVLAWLVICLFIVSVAQADEPKFCSVEYFIAHELRTNAPNTKRLHSFQVGRVELNGLAVGGSNAHEVAMFSKAPANRKFCTWYWNEGNDDAERMFHHQYLKGPYESWLPWVSRNEIARHYEEKLTPQIEKMIKCSEDYHYLAFGCDGQKHRGPSVFAYWLALAGCSPKVSTQIANHFWKLNGVPNHTRVAIAEKGQRLGNQYPQLRKRLQKVMGE